MVYPQDERFIETGGALIEVVRELAGTHSGFRAAHAKGLMFNGTFTPTETAKSLSTAPHFNKPHTPIVARLSNSDGDPTLADNNPKNKPKGLAVRFKFDAGDCEASHTDIATVTVDGFPTSTGDESLAFFHASRDGTLADFLPTHPHAQAFLKLPNPFPTSFAHARFFGVNAVKLVDSHGKGLFVRYRIEPVAGVKSLTDEELKGKTANYLFDSIPGLVKQGPILYRFTAQVADEGDVTDDCAVHWPESRRVVDLGTISLEAVMEDSSEEEKHILFDPLPRGVPGLEPSGDPLLRVRNLVYHMSARERGAL